MAAIEKHAGPSRKSCLAIVFQNPILNKILAESLQHIAVRLLQQKLSTLSRSLVLLHVIF